MINETNISMTVLEMTTEQKNAHLAKIMGKINMSDKFIIEDVTPVGYGPE